MDKLGLARLPGQCGRGRAWNAGAQGAPAGRTGWPGALPLLSLLLRFGALGAQAGVDPDAYPDIDLESVRREGGCEKGGGSTVR